MEDVGSMVEWRVIVKTSNAPDAGIIGTVFVRARAQKEAITFEVEFVCLCLCLFVLFGLIWFDLV